MLGHRSCTIVGTSYLLLIYHIWESNYRPHIFLSSLCQAISQMDPGFFYFLRMIHVIQAMLQRLILLAPLRCVLNVKWP